MNRVITTILPLLVLCGCASPALVNRMKAHGVTHLNTGKIILYGSEADVGSHVSVKIEEHFLIQGIWDTIYQSRPERVWYASGYRRANFYADTDLDHPAFTLWINASDACHINKQTERFRCPKLHSVVMRLLQDAHEKRKKGEQRVGP